MKGQMKRKKGESNNKKEVMMNMNEYWKEECTLVVRQRSERTKKEEGAC